MLTKRQIMFLAKPFQILLMAILYLLVLSFSAMATTIDFQSTGPNSYGTGFSVDLDSMLVTNPVPTDIVVTFGATIATTNLYVDDYPSGSPNQVLLWENDTLTVYLPYAVTTCSVDLDLTYGTFSADGFAQIDNTNTNRYTRTTLETPFSQFSITATDWVIMDNLFFPDPEPVVSTVPEPSSMILLGSGLLALARFARRRKQQG